MVFVFGVMIKFEDVLNGIAELAYVQQLICFHDLFTNFRTKICSKSTKNLQTATSNTLLDDLAALAFKSEN